MTFELHPDLQRDGIPIGRFELCQVLLIDDQTYPWFVLVPQRAGIRDPYQLDSGDYALLWTESREFSAGIMRAFSGDKLNVAALGNVTPQLHVHHIVRFESDPAWPGPVWGKLPMQAYSQSGIDEIRSKLNHAAICGLNPIA